MQIKAIYDNKGVDGANLGTKIDFGELPINIQEHLLKRIKE